MGLFSGLSNYLFGQDKVKTANTEQQAFQNQELAKLYQAREAQDYARQASFAQYLQQVIAGTRPSVAGTQLQIGADQAAKSAMAAASGGTGVNGALNQYAGILAGADLMATTNQQAALLRAKEQADAAAASNALYADMGKRTAALESSTGQTGLDYNALLTKQYDQNAQQGNKETAATIQGTGQAIASVI